jgi:predicted Zn-dependent protease with MMP-like domain
MRRPEELYERFVLALEGEDLEGAERLLERLRGRAPDSWARSWAEIGWTEVTGADPRPRLERHLELWPEDADAHHRLGARLLEAGEDAPARAHWQRVWALDEAADAAPEAEDAGFVEAAAIAALDELPEPFASELARVAVLVEPRPSLELVTKGFDPRAYGLFEGPDRALATSLDAPPAVTRIVLFLANLVADFPEHQELWAQVQVTVLHEVGHYFGLDEDDMARLGLD